MTRIAYNPDCDRVYLIGGAKDQKSKHTVNNVNLIHFSQNRIQNYEKQAMIDSRASFGCFYNSRGTEEIIVTGGYTNGNLFNKCEKYSVRDNQWNMLPSLTEAKASSSLCMQNDRYLYCFGGLQKSDKGHPYLSNSIEILDLLNPTHWHKQNISLPISGCDIGCLPIKKDQLLIFGGWNKTAQRGAYILTRKPAQCPFSRDEHDIKPLEFALDQPDFFLVNGIAMKNKEPRKVYLCGHANIFVFNLDLQRFEKGD